MHRADADAGGVVALAFEQAAEVRLGAFGDVDHGGDFTRPAVKLPALPHIGGRDMGIDLDTLAGDHCAPLKGEAHRMPAEAIAWHLAVLPGWRASADAEEPSSSQTSPWSPPS